MSGVDSNEAECGVGAVITRRRFGGWMVKAGVVAAAGVGRLVGFAPTAYAQSACSTPPTNCNGSCTVSCLGNCSSSQSCCNMGGNQQTVCCFCSTKGGCGYYARVLGQCTAGGTCYYCCVPCNA